MTKRDRYFQTNLDKSLTQAEIEEHERKERRTALIDDRYKDAERREAEGRDTPDIIYSGIQKDGVYTADPVKDKSAASVKGRRSLPVKEIGVSPEGDLELTLGEAATEALAQRYFCHNCWDPQPDNPISWERAVRKLEGVIGDRPGWAAHSEMCPYCGSRLGISGEAAQEKAELWQMTPEQRRIIESMFGSMRAEEE